MFAALLLAQGLAALVLVARLLPGGRRVRPTPPRSEGLRGTTVTVIIPTLNEADRLEPCLSGLAKQDEPLTEILVVDSASADATEALVAGAAARDPRIRLIHDPALPPGWIGKAWALQNGLGEATGEWILGLDADTEPREGMVAGAVSAALAHGLEQASFSPLFAGQDALERWLQPALLVTLVYRFGAPGVAPRPSRLMANGQCFLARRATLLAHGGYAPARRSFADDVALARHLARRGVPCGFLDGSRLYRVRSYRSGWEMWREWGRSVDLGDTVPTVRRWADFAFLVLVQALPVPLLGLHLAGVLREPSAVVGLNGLLIAIRVGLQGPLAASYERRGIVWWLSWLSDPLAVSRILWSLIRRPTQWRGRTYRDVRKG